tara:strand:+ start:348 stop:455 length:108 start_codon:yes stop_codon:yes gene_type:complete
MELVRRKAIVYVKRIILVNNARSFAMGVEVMEHVK